MVVGIGYSLAQTKIYRAYANVTVPQPASLQGQQIDPAQYLDSQVLLLQSQDVAQRAASIANRELGSATLTVGDFAGANRKLTINPPVTATPGAYGASIVALWFQWPKCQDRPGGCQRCAPGLRPGPICFHRGPGTLHRRRH